MRTYFIEDRKEIDEIICSCKTCYFAMSVDDQPYVLPMNFALDGDSIILHSAMEGRMWESIKTNPKVCINWTLGEDLAWQDVRVGCSYRVKSKSVNVEGPVEFIEDFDEKYRCLTLLMKQYSDREFKFGTPAVKNVGIFKVKIENITAKEFGAKAITPWNS
ncbi:pyridoxamine 5'-phosphate oxidase family protein [Draconibacterium sp. IB214405]|uniref:pyridoxamine 5'-phosphate oxidase family protein n=1 Tax=Draconibacterium sp. IB214405 TaxID=3097352 RepID=UPI002A0F8EBA|nr:pyridoxamine 5'-phosphate oxidase family protein [Draconibacterium sp. IB214405]MDX8338120.1 pyridoxamine 5'-phosphate oxidase family protein [Draconibacterium sp. IB214405]